MVDVGEACGCVWWKKQQQRSEASPLQVVRIGATFIESVGVIHGVRLVKVFSVHGNTEVSCTRQDGPLQQLRELFLRQQLVQEVMLLCEVNDMIRGLISTRVCNLMGGDPWEHGPKTVSRPGPTFSK